MLESCGAALSMRKIEETYRLLLLKAMELPQPMVGINTRNCFLAYDTLNHRWLSCPHDEMLGQKTVLPFAYDPNAECPEWQKFLDRVQPDPKIQSYLQKLFGYILLGEGRPHYECIAIWQGNGANGKSVSLGTLTELIGKDNCSFLSLHELSPKNIEMIVGKTVNIGSESERSDKVVTSILKKWASRENLTAEPKYRHHYTFIPFAIPLFAVNEIPAIDDKTDGIWRRVHRLEWKVTIPQNERDTGLSHKLQSELPGIMNWALEGAVQIMENGFEVPDEVQSSTQELRTESNSVALFADACIETGETYYIAKNDLYKAYSQWCSANGYKALSNVNFGKELKRSFKHLSDTKTRSGYVTMEGLEASRQNAYAGLYIPEGRLAYERLTTEGRRLPTLAAIGSVAEPASLL